MNKKKTNMIKTAIRYFLNRVWEWIKDYTGELLVAFLLLSLVACVAWLISWGCEVKGLKKQRCDNAYETIMQIETPTQQDYLWYQKECEEYRAYGSSCGSDKGGYMYVPNGSGGYTWM